MGNQWITNSLKQSKEFSISTSKIRLKKSTTRVSFCVILTSKRSLQVEESKSRGSFANLYAIYVLVEDYIARDYHTKEGYKDAEGAVFGALFKRQRELPFGQKLQNHALNHRLNEEFRKYFPDCEHIPIVRNDNRYWFNEHLIRIEIDGAEFNLAEAAIEVIDAYVEAKRDAFEKFIQFCETVRDLSEQEVIDFIASLLDASADARIFEIVHLFSLEISLPQSNHSLGIRD